MPDPHQEPRPKESEVAENPAGLEPRSTGLPRRITQKHLVQDELNMSAVSRRSSERLERARQLATACARIADDNRGREILLLDLRSATSLVDYFVIVTAGSRRQAQAIASEIDAEMKRRDEAKLGREGTEEGRWILIDYGDFVVHLFSEDARAYYAIEEIWGDSPRLEWADPDRPPARVRAAVEPPPAQQDTD